MSTSGLPSIGRNEKIVLVVLRLMGVVALFFAIIPAAIGIWYVKSTRDFLAHAMEAQGVIVDTKLDNTGDALTSVPVVEFADAKGESHRFEGSMGREAGYWKSGEKLRVLYDQRDPRKARISRSAADDWVLAGVLLGSALTGFVAAGALFFVAGYLKRKAVKLQQESWRVNA